MAETTVHSTQVYDYIVVGAGSGGCTVANRLVDAGKRVVLLEAGPADNTPLIGVPATFAKVIGTARSSIYRSEPEHQVGGRSLPVPQGRTLGGGSSINAMVYIRGQAEDYDTWRDLGCPGWGWQDVLPVFKRLERNERLSDPYHGNDGPLPVSDPRYRHPLSLAYVRAAQQAGFPYNDDFNGASQLGVGFYQTTTLNGRRQSTSEVFLKPFLRHRNLTVITEALVTGITVENGAATGIAYRVKGGGAISVSAREEVILAAGTLATPKLLMLSGIGPVEDLSSLGIAVRRDLKGVGRNLQDHVATPVYALTREPVSLLGQDRGFRAFWHGAQYVFSRTGILASNVVESGGFFDTDGDGRADVQFHVLPIMIAGAEHGSIERHGMELNPCVLRPKSRGRVKLRSSDVTGVVSFHTGFLSHKDDLATLLAGVRTARRILRQPALRAVIKQEHAPGAAEDLSDEVLMAHVMATAKMIYHPVGTCRMGTDDDAVVDRQLSGSWRVTPQDLRRVDHATADQRQHQRADDHDRGPLRGVHPRWGAQFVRPGAFGPDRGGDQGARPTSQALRGRPRRASITHGHQTPTRGNWVWQAKP